MASRDEQILRAAKEIVVKFIEVGRVSPAGFPETFRSIYQTLEQLTKPAPLKQEEAPSPDPKRPAKNKSPKKK